MINDTIFTEIKIYAHLTDFGTEQAIEHDTNGNFTSF